MDLEIGEVYVVTGDQDEINHRFEVGTHVRILKIAPRGGVGGLRYLCTEGLDSPPDPTKTGASSESPAQWWVGPKDLAPSWTPVTDEEIAEIVRLLEAP